MDDAQDEQRDQQTVGEFRFQQFAPTRDVVLRYDDHGTQPTFRMARHKAASGDQGYLYDVEFDLSNVPHNQDFEFGFEARMPGMQGATDGDRLIFPIVAPTDVATMWVLLPEGRPYRDFEVIAYNPAAPAKVDSIEPTYLFEWLMVRYSAG